MLGANVDSLIDSKKRFVVRRTFFRTLVKQYRQKHYTKNCNAGDNFTIFVVSCLGFGEQIQGNGLS